MNNVFLHFNKLFANGFFFFLIFGIITYIIIRIIEHFIFKYLKSKEQSNVDLIHRIIIIALNSIWAYLMCLEIIPLKTFAISILASGGIVAVILGFASQESVSNLINGLFIIIFKPFIIGDIIRVENGLLSGTVENITLRHTVIRSFENTKQVISNNRLNSLIIENISDYKDKKGAPLIFILTPNNDIVTAIEIIKKAIINSDLFVGDKNNITVYVNNVSVSGIELRSMVFADTLANTSKLLSNLRLTILADFQKNNIVLASIDSNVLAQK